MLVNRSVLINCGIEAENHFLLESLGTCHEANSKLVMSFTRNAAFGNYLDQFTNMTESLRFPIIQSKSTFKQTLLIALNVCIFDSDLLTAPRNLNDFINQYKCEKEICDLQKGMILQILLTKISFLITT